MLSICVSFYLFLSDFFPNKYSKIPFLARFRMIDFFHMFSGRAQAAGAFFSPDKTCLGKTCFLGP